VPIHVLIADDHRMVREGLKALLERDGFKVVSEASDGYEAVRLTRTLRPDVAVLDLTMPLLNGLDAAREIHRTSPGVALILLTMHAGPTYVFESLQAGVRGYVLKTQASSNLVQAIEEVFRGGCYLGPTIARTVVESCLVNPRSVADGDLLSLRQRQVLQLVAEGRTSKEIATLLQISAKTAESHRIKIMEKLDVHSTAGLVRYAIRRGLIQA
jgi:DNA-binding NarL/FixJ family response regulator